jgi:hypothetical protein
LWSLQYDDIMEREFCVRVTKKKERERERIGGEADIKRNRDGKEPDKWNYTEKVYI